jgi:RecA/RadA recombinase
MSTDDLTSIDGIGETIAEKLISAGIPNVVALAAATVSKLVGIGVTKSAAQKMLASARERCSAIFGFVTGDELIDQFKRREYLTSGTEGLDSILGGKGFETQKVYEIYGPEGTGKSNLLHQLVCTAYLPPNEGGLGAGTIYMDTEGTFSIKRIQQLAPRFGIDPEEITRNVIKASPPTSDVLLFLCEAQLEKMASQTGARFFCLDSLATHFRAEFGAERQMMPERQQRASKVIHALKRVAQATNGVAILTNQVTANVTGMGKPWAHSMGLLVGHESQVRIMVRTKSTADGLRLFEIEKALDLPPANCILKITDEGFIDADAKKVAKKSTKKTGEVAEEAAEADSEESDPDSEEAETSPKVKSKSKTKAKATT